MLVAGDRIPEASVWTGPNDSTSRYGGMPKNREGARPPLVAEFARIRFLVMFVGTLASSATNSLSGHVFHREMQAIDTQAHSVCRPPHAERVCFKYQPRSHVSGFPDLEIQCEIRSSYGEGSSETLELRDCGDRVVS